MRPTALSHLRHEIRAFSFWLSSRALPGCLAARINGLEKQTPAFSDHWDDINVAINIHFVQELVRVSRLVRVLKHLNELAAFDQSDNLLKADASFQHQQ